MILKINKVMRSIFLLIFLLSTFEGNSHADNVKMSNLIKLQQAITNEVEMITQRLNFPAFVSVSVVPKQQNLSLPSTAFSLKETVLTDAKGAVDLAEVTVELYSPHDVLPVSLGDLIKSILLKYSKSPKIVHKQVPKELLHAEESTILGVRPSALAGFLFTMLALTLVFVALLLSQRRGTVSKIETALSSGFSKISDTLEVGMASSSPQDSSTAASQATGKDQAATALKAQSLREMTDEGLLALISDCYWCAKDNYAAFIWSALPPERRRKLIGAFAYLDEYGRYILTKTFFDEGLENDPYYLEPLSLHAVDNKTLTELVRNNKDIYWRLSNMRVENLNLAPTESMEITKLRAETKKNKEAIVLPKAQASPPRVFGRIAKLKISTLEEEHEILSLEGLTMEMKESVLSLGWSRDLSDEAMSDILRPFSAADLAASLLGPEDVVARIFKLIPEKKATMVKSYTDKINASRQSSSFIRLHRSIMTALMSQSLVVDGAVVQNNEVNSGSGGAAAA